MNVSAEFLAGLPKAELHVHQVGSASPRIVAELAERHPGRVPSDLDELRRFFVFDDFPHFIANYLAVVDLVRTPEDVRLLTYEIGREMVGQQIRYAELTVTPYMTVHDHMSAEAFLEAIEDARVGAARDFDIELRWIFDIPADFGLPAADLTLSCALDHDVPGLVAFGLGGSEIGFPRSMFRSHFDRARAAGLHSVPHAGETGGPEVVWDALRTLGAERIEHGIAAATDPALMEHLRQQGITLDVCPTSNVALRVVPALDQHPIRTLVEAGVPVSINTDDPPMFDTDLTGEYAIAARLLDLDARGVADLALAAVRGSFAEPAVKDRLTREISAYADRPGPASAAAS